MSTSWCFYSRFCKEILGEPNVDLQADACGEDDGAEGRRLKLINITDSIDKRVVNLFNLIEKDVLSAVHSDNMQISPYTTVHAMQ